MCWQRNLLGNLSNQLDKLLLAPKEKLHLCLKKKKEKKANQDCRSVISFQITEDVVLCCEMGLRQEVNQVYLLHRLALEEWRARASLYPGPALQGPEKRLRSETTTPLRYFALFTLPKQAENSLRSSTLEQRLRTFMLGVRLKSGEGKVKAARPSGQDRGYRVQITWVLVWVLLLTDCHVAKFLLFVFQL